MMDMTPPWLAVIDMQRIFALPESAWAAPRFAEILEPVDRLVAAAGDRVTFTRFLAAAEPTGAWVDYYRQWPFALQPADAPLYQLVEEVGGARTPTLDATTFGKWTPALADLVRPAGTLVLAGVSTDCCVLSTALAAVDAGVRVRVVADACAGVDDLSQRAALHTLSLFAPMVEVVTTDEAVADWSR